MKRRGLTVLLGFVLLLVLVLLTSQAKVPYVALSPGPTVDVLGTVDDQGHACDIGSADAESCHLVIDVTDAETTDSSGQLRMVTVSVQGDISILEAIKGWLWAEDAVVPRELIYPEGQSEDDVEQQNKEEFAASQSTAETAALRELGYPVRVTVTEVAADSAAAGRLQDGDIIDTVDGVAVTSTQKLLELIREQPPGAALQIGYTRAGTAGSVELTTRESDDGNPRIGVIVENEQQHPFELNIRLDDIGGPSAGLMFALGIIDKLSPEDLTRGVVIAGTGTIDDEGNVGPIGGVAQKVHGAFDAGATVFFTPAQNCAVAKANAPEGLRLVKVTTLDEALAALAALPDTVGLPSC